VTQAPDVVAAASGGASLADAVLAGDRRALARALTVVENRPRAAGPLVDALVGRTGRAAITGITGPPGVGKSTLVRALIGELRAVGETVGVICVDPSSTVTSGALLGDRVRMGGHHRDDGVFIRSMASRGQLGGLSAAAFSAALVMDAAGFDHVLVETVGVGQSELEVSGLADAVVLVLMPGSGDAMQFLKAGIMEIPSVIAVNKSDEPGADRFATELRRALAIAHPRSGLPRIVRTNGLTGDGVADLLGALADHRAERDGEEQRARRERALRDQALRGAVDLLRDRLAEAARRDPAVVAALEEVAARRVSPAGVARILADEVTTNGDGEA
jgi:LAO/AO transport system kinase